MNQLPLPIPAQHGGRRKGAGRPNRSGLQAHVRRPSLDKRHPVHVTIKLAHGLPGLRRKDIFKMLRKAVRKARNRGFHVVHFAILSNHLHLILEPQDKSVSRAMQSLEISFARRLNQALGRSGGVFRGRYHLRVLKTPSETRRALAYVLTNEAKHGRSNLLKINPFSSAYRFRDLDALTGYKVTLTAWSEDFIEDWLEQILSPAETWLLRIGWKRAR